MPLISDNLVGSRRWSKCKQVNANLTSPFKLTSTVIKRDPLLVVLKNIIILDIVYLLNSQNKIYTIYIIKKNKFTELIS